MYSAVAADTGPVIEVEGVRKAFGGTKALAGVGLTAEPGRVLEFGLADAADRLARTYSGGMRRNPKVKGA